MSYVIGEQLLQQQEQVFELWHQVRDGTLARSQFIEAVSPIRQQVKALLEEGAAYPWERKKRRRWQRRCAPDFHWFRHGRIDCQTGWSAYQIVWSAVESR